MSTPIEKFLSEEQVDFFQQNGYLVVDFQLEQAMLNRLIESVEPHYPNEFRENPHAPVRLQDAWRDVDEVRQLAVNDNALTSLEQLFGRKPLPFQTLNFPSATQQLAHSDTIHFNSSPKGFVAGVWIALEDIDMENGPLIYYPGSHKLQEYTMESFGLGSGSENYGKYEQAIQQLINEKELTPDYGTIKKGEALIWHSNLLHGGSELKNGSRTRHSQVTHYFFSGCKYYTPMESGGQKMAVRSPEWIPDTPWSSRSSFLGRKLRSLASKVKRKLYS